MDSFLECESVDQANQVDMKVYTFIGFNNGNWQFKIRQRK